MWAKSALLAIISHVPFYWQQGAVKIEVAQRPRKSVYPLLSIREAVETIFKHCHSTKIEAKNLTNCLGFVCAEDVFTDEPVPAFRASIKDGYAVLAEDADGVRKVVSSQNAGDEASFVLEPMTCVRLSTGAVVPVNCNAVVQVEDTELIQSEGNEEKSVRILRAPEVGQDIRQIGSDLDVGECALKRGTKITSAEIGILASLGKTTVHVFNQPTVTIFSTGNELRSPSTVPLPKGKVRDSNSMLLGSLLKSYGFLVHDWKIVGDESDEIMSAFCGSMFDTDVVITTGGVSMGEKDLIKQVLQTDLKFDIHFGRVFMKPGKPTTFATGIFNGKKKLVFALPGNPVSAWVTAHLFVIPALYRMSGLDFFFNEINFKGDEYALDERPEYCRARFVPYDDEEDTDCPSVELVDNNQISSRLLSTRNAQLLLKLPQKSRSRTHLHTGDIVRAMVIGV
ncbi:unnamed protein product [Soboliphyme baturini]|uniref:MoCF_biosynth domain-containing protein n=1 Tax=Soboliphyme baturini TaxID=241478 RepID=A0A183IEQ2_9BILA|nr:unnamed protein product [Soboliphyme baturini]